MAACLYWRRGSTYNLDPLARSSVGLFPTPILPPLKYPSRAGMAKLMKIDTPADTPAHAPRRVGEMLAAGGAEPTPAVGVGVSDGVRLGVGVVEEERVEGIVGVGVAVGVGGTGRQSVCPGLLVVPEGQGSHTAAPLSFETKPSGQGEQADASDAPTDGFAVPGSHNLQESSVLHVPAGQGGPHRGPGRGHCPSRAGGTRALLGL